MLPVGNSNKIGANVRGIILQSQLYVCARFLCSSIQNETIASDQGQDAIVGKLYKKDVLSAVSDFYDDLNQLHNTRRGPRASFKNF